MSEEPTELTVEEALRLAIRAHRAGHLSEAEPVYKRILEAAPDYVDAIHFYGLMLHHRDASDEALAMLERSIALDPTAGRYNNLGNALVERGRKDDAIDAYARSVELDPKNAADAFNNLGLLQRSVGHAEESEAAFQRALEIDPRHRGALVNFGNLRTAQDRHQDALKLYWTALSIDAKDFQARRMLGFAYYGLKQFDAAANVFRLWLQEDPGNPTAQHMLAACTGVDVPERGSDAYIQETFDGFAANFDAKLESLPYRAPQLITAAVAKAVGEPARDRAILDAGCGTGLCGPLLAPYASSLVGVDLSEGMLERARVRGLYQELVKGELTEFIASRPDSADLIVSADTLCYFGPLDAVFAASARALRPGGWLFFSVEAAADADAPAGHKLNPHGRYSHARAYLERELEKVGLAVTGMDAEVLRMEGQAPVNGFVVTAHKAVVPHTSQL